VDAYAGYHIGFDGSSHAIKSVDLMFNVTNLMDRRYLGTVDSAGTPGYYFIAPGRTAVFSIKANL
jgi:outer membrane receptor protein involved in Fe transport